MVAHSPLAAVPGAADRSGAPLLTVDRVSVVYDGRVRAVDRVTLRLHAGETLSLVGESGSGKTSLVKTILGLIRPTEGSIGFAGLGAPGGADFHRQVQMVFQEAAASLSPRLRIRSLLTEPLRIHGQSVAAAWPALQHLLGRVGLPASLLDKYPHQISGGQARRVAIARALVLRPRLVIADEPTAGLDVSVQGELLNLLADLQRDFGLTYLMVSHNLGVVRAISDRIAVMYLGRLVEQGTAERVFAAPAHPYTAALIAARPRLAWAEPEADGSRRRRPALQGEMPDPANPPPGCPFQTRCPIVAEICRTVDPPAVRFADGGEALCHKPLTGSLTGALAG